MCVGCMMCCFFKYDVVFFKGPCRAKVFNAVCHVDLAHPAFWELALTGKALRADRHCFLLYIQ